MPKPYLATGGKPVFNEFITPIGLTVHCYHDKPQLKFKDEANTIPDMDKDGFQIAEFKVTLAWTKTRSTELQPMIDLATLTRNQGWPESGAPGAFFALQPFFRDGDNPEHNTKRKEYLLGTYYLNFKQKAIPKRDQQGKVYYEGAPGLLGPHGPEDKIMPSDMYAGCTARVSGIMFATEYMGKHFISTRLNNIQKYQDGDRIGGGVRPTAESQFGALVAPPAGGLGLGLGSQANGGQANTGGLGGSLLGGAPPAGGRMF